MMSLPVLAVWIGMAPAWLLRRHASTLSTDATPSAGRTLLVADLNLRRAVVVGLEGGGRAIRISAA
jgi:hypothetical protein